MRNSKTFQVTFHHLPSLEAQMESVGAEFFSLRIPGSLSQRVKNFLQHSYTLQREAISETQVRKCGMAGMGPMGESLLPLGPTETTRNHCCNRLYRHEMFSSLLQLTGAFSLSLFFQLFLPNEHGDLHPILCLLLFSGISILPTCDLHCVGFLNTQLTRRATDCYLHIQCN